MLLWVVNRRRKQVFEGIMNKTNFMPCRAGSFGTWKFLLILVILPSSLAAFIIKLPGVEETAGSTVFNIKANTDHQWSYHLDKVMSDDFLTKIVTLDSQTGSLVLSKALSCYEMLLFNKSSPLLGIDMMSHDASSTQPFVIRVSIPIFISSNGGKCLHEEADQSFADAQLNNDHILTEAVKAQHVTVNVLSKLFCIPGNTHLLSIHSLLPLVVTEECQVLLYHKKADSDIYIDVSTGYLWLKNDICLSHAYVASVEIHMNCTNSTYLVSGTYPLHIVLQAENRESNESIKDSSEALLKSRKKRSRKMNTPPSFPQAKYLASVLEEQRAGLILDSITASDPDPGDAGVLTYSLLAMKDGRSQMMFSMDSTSGQITTVQPLDRESIPIHYFQLIAKDRGRPVQSAVAMLIISVLDVNDHSPTFEKSFYSSDVSESIGVGTTILTVRASDEDADNNAEIEYSISNPSEENGVFRIDPVLGSITTTKHLDRETKERYCLEVVATDRAMATERKSSSATVEISLVDENDNKPVFESTLYTVEIPEDIDYTTSPILAEIKATDADSDANGIIRYSITGGNTKNTFVIDAISGHLSLVQPLDFETNPDYHLNIRAQDGGSPPKSNSITAIIRVIDVNDNSPKFYTSAYQEMVMESIPVGQTILKVQAYDSDSGQNGMIAYEIHDAPAAMPIVVDANSGVIFTTGELDREKEARYSFKVEAHDHGLPSRTATASVDIIVRDVNDNAPVFNPKIYQELVSEESLPGSPVVIVSAQDADEDENGRIIYAIESGNIRGTFNIISQMGHGLILLTRVLNFKEQNRYVLTITASDSVHQDSATVYVNVTDANLHRPVFQGSPYVTRIDEDTPVGSGIFKVTAVDNDSGENARLTYTIEDNDAFQIISRTGDIVLKTPLDREKIAGYTLTVTVSDNGRPSKSDTTDIEVIVVDVNDNSPVFAKSLYSGKVSEDSFVGTSVVSISASDEDIGLNGRVRYSFDSGDSGNGDFIIDPTLGIIRTAKELDRERVARYSLIAYAIDRGTPEKSTSVNIDVEVEDVNDNSPQFETSNIILYIKENSPIWSVVGEIHAVDVDEGGNSVVEYSIVGGTDAESFSLVTQHQESAILTTLVELDYESDKKVYTVIVRARSFHLFSDAHVKIVVVDINDNMPYMRDFTILFNNYKDSFPTESIGTLPAFDPDISDKLKFAFISGNEAKLLHLDEDTGEIRLDARLNSDVSTNATFLVSVTDGINEVRATCRLFVRLVTEEMLNNSITVRINNMHRSAFLSPLHDLFVSAVASIIPTTEDHIFIINIQEDNEVQEKILNVSFSVRQRIEYSHDVFYKPQFLKERFYFQRTLMAKLSTLEVLPFDDNLCLREPCLNFEECVSTLRFRNASSIISSDTMLFRPLQPHSSFECRCPLGFTGMNSEYLCDTEVNLCYSNPCGQNGKCIQYESGYTCSCTQGFTGDHCEVDLHSRKYTSCPKDICKSPSRCSPLIRGGIRCEICSSYASGGSGCTDCASMEHRTKFCQLTTRSFPNGSFLLFPSLKRRHRFTIRLSFATRERNGLLLYNGRYNNKHDFIGLEIINSQVVFSFSLGTTVTHVTAHTKDGVSDGKWHQVTVEYFNRTATLTVDFSCDTQLSVLYGSELPDYRCAAKASQVLEARCSDITETCHRFLDLTGPLQLGSLPSLPTEYQVRNAYFAGCMRDLYVDGKLIDMNDHAWNSDTVEGCPQKASFCQSAPCRNGGTCQDGWGMYICECSKGWTGKDCSQESEIGYRLTSRGHLLYLRENHGLANIRLPWYNGLSFRTRQQNQAVLMTIELGGTAVNDQPSQIVIRLVNGTIYYVHPHQTVVFDEVLVNDGVWHYLETRWLPGEILITLDYGHFQKSTRIGDWIVGQAVGQIVVGKQLNGDQSGTSGAFIGCVKAVRVGSSPGILLSKPEIYDAETGCNIRNLCGSSDTCLSDRSSCVDIWESHECKCLPGRIGSDCAKICDRYNPCHNGATCVEPKSASNKYFCRCDLYHDGEYCERQINASCPSTWWGSPICGPCDCPKDKGFDPRCNKTTGECYCKENHYRQGDFCVPCNCYEFGSYGRSCDKVTGQCHCRNGVTGPRCSSCYSKFAEVTLRGCEVVYNACPKTYFSQIWWKRTAFGEIATEECPEGTVGMASRFCNDTEGWKEPDLSNCSSVSFLDLGQQLKLIERRDLRLNTLTVKGIMSKLDLATRQTSVLHRMDLIVAYRLLCHILNHESTQNGLNLTHTQDRNFVQHVANCVSRILDTVYTDEWMRLNQEFDASVSLMKALEVYSITLARNMMFTFTQPMDAVHDNIVIGLDFISISNLSHVTIPKYNNKVQNYGIFDTETKVLLPMKLFADSEWRNSSAGRQMPTVSYILFRTLGDLLPQRYDETIRLPGNVATVVNSPLLMLNIIDGDHLIGNQLVEPIRMQFQPLVQNNRSSAQCVHWSDLSRNTRETWSGSGCQLSLHHSSEPGFVECECSHLTTFAVLMEARSPQALVSSIYNLEVATCVGVGLAVVCFVVAIVVFCILLRIGTNSLTIHLNLMIVLLCANGSFLLGVSRTEPKIVCRLVAILLQYFYTSAFAWVFVESLHLYRMITSILDINRGPMHFYYATGYVIPGIIIGLSVGLSTDSYGNQFFCWLKLHDLIFLTFAGPVAFLIMISAVLFLISLASACRGLPKHNESDSDYMKYEVGAGSILLVLMTISLFFGVLSVNDSIPAFRYLFAVFTGLQGIFVIAIYIILNKEVKSQLKYLRYLKKDKNKLPSYSTTRNRHHIPCYGGPNRYPIAMPSNSAMSPSSEKNVGGPVNNKPLDSYPSTANIFYNAAVNTGTLPKEAIPMANFTNGNSKKNRSGRYSDSEGSDTQIADGTELASSHSSDEDYESYGQA